MNVRVAPGRGPDGSRAGRPCRRGRGWARTALRLPPLRRPTGCGRGPVSGARHCHSLKLPVEGAQAAGVSSSKGKRLLRIRVPAGARGLGSSTLLTGRRLLADAHRVYPGRVAKPSWRWPQGQLERDAWSRRSVFIEEAMSETSLSTPQPSPRQTARVPPPHGRQGRAGRAEGAPAEGPAPSFSLTWKTIGRSEFEALGRARSARSGPLALSWVPAPHGRPPCLAFAIGKKVGNAVTRNRLRRRLREAARRPPGLPPGTYLVRVRPEAVTLTFSELVRHLQRAATMVQRLTPPPGPRPAEQP